MHTDTRMHICTRNHIHTNSQITSLPSCQSVDMLCELTALQLYDLAFNRGSSVQAGHCRQPRGKSLHIMASTLWPSGLRRWLKAPVRKGVGSNPTAVTGSWEEAARTRSGTQHSGHKRRWARQHDVVWDPAEITATAPFRAPRLPPAALAEIITVSCASSLRESKNGMAQSACYGIRRRRRH